MCGGTAAEWVQLCSIEPQLSPPRGITLILEVEKGHDRYPLACWERLGVEAEVMDAVLDPVLLAEFPVSSYWQNFPSRRAVVTIYPAGAYFCRGENKNMLSDAVWHFCLHSSPGQK